MRCWNCGTQLAETDVFCPTCGIDNVQAKISSRQLMICPTCSCSFPDSELDSKGISADCPACRKQKALEVEKERERHIKQQAKFEASERASLRNQRNADRFEVSKCFVRISRLGLTARLFKGGDKKMGPLIDLSRTGLQCEANGEFEKGETVDIHLLVPAFQNPLHMKGIVRWTEPVGANGTRMGVQFDTTDAKTAEHLKALEKHDALRHAADIREAKKSSSTLMKAVTPKQSAPRRDGSNDRPADF